MQRSALALLLCILAAPAAAAHHPPPEPAPQATAGALAALQADLAHALTENARQDAQTRALLQRSLDAVQADIAREAATEKSLLATLVDAQKNPGSPPNSFSAYQLLYAGFGAALSAIIGGLAVWYIAHRYTLRLKMFDSTLEFSKRFGDMVERQSRLNRAYADARAANPSLPATNIEREEARAWWWHFFDLVLFEYDFFKQGLLWDERFARWMRWRWHEYNATGADIWRTNGMDYREGWDDWKNRRANQGHRLIAFLDEIHAAADEDEVARLVRAASPGFWRGYHLDD
jgi:hypothetical protein